MIATEERWGKECSGRCQYPFKRSHYNPLLVNICHMEMEHRPTSATSSDYPGEDRYSHFIWNQPVFKYWQVIRFFFNIVKITHKMYLWDECVQGIAVYVKKKIQYQFPRTLHPAGFKSVFHHSNYFLNLNPQIG